MQSNVIGGAGWTCWTLIVVMMLSLVCRVFAHHYCAYRELFVRLCLCVRLCLFVRSFVYLYICLIHRNTHTNTKYICYVTYCRFLKMTIVTIITTILFITIHDMCICIIYIYNVYIGLNKKHLNNHNEYTIAMLIINPEVTAAANQGVPLRFLGPKDNGMLQGYAQAIRNAEFSMEEVTTGDH